MLPGQFRIQPNMNYGPENIAKDTITHRRVTMSQLLKVIDREGRLASHSLLLHGRPVKFLNMFFCKSAHLQTKDMQNAQKQAWVQVKTNQIVKFTLICHFSLFQKILFTVILVKVHTKAHKRKQSFATNSVIIANYTLSKSFKAISHYRNVIGFFCIKAKEWY